MPSPSVSAAVLAVGSPALAQDGSGETAKERRRRRPRPGPTGAEGHAWARTLAGREPDQCRPQSPRTAEAADGTRVDTWYDASGHGRHLTQQRVEAQPLFVDGALRSTARQASWNGPGLKATLRISPCSSWPPPFQFGRLPRISGDAPGGPGRLHERRDCRHGLWVYGTIRRAQRRGERLRWDDQLDGRPSDFGIVRRMTISSAPGPGGTALRIDGRAAGSRDRGPSVLRHRPDHRGGTLFRLSTVDAWVPRRRHPADPHLRPRPRRGRAERRSKIISPPAMAGKGQIVRPARPGPGKPLVAVGTRLRSRCWSPGFSTRELPVDLTNVNNVRYRPDGKLVALAYDGNIHLLSDARRRRRGRERRALLEEQGEPRRPDRHGTDTAGVSPGRWSVRRVQGEGVAHRRRRPRRQGREGDRRRQRLERAAARRRRPRRRP